MGLAKLRIECVIMLTTYFRSSSYNTFDNCQMQYFLNYVLGLEYRATLKATLGNVIHKALECLALQKKCQQEGLRVFNDDAFGKVKISECDPDCLIERSFDWHRKNFTHDDWDNSADLKFCRKYMHEALTFDGGRYDPRNRKVIEAEQRFDFEIEKSWAKYCYILPNGKKLEGNLSLKGTIDLITEVRPGVLEIIDWKTGKHRTNFATGKVKDFHGLMDDPQLRMYHYAAHQLYPEIKHIIMTIYYIQAGGPFTLPLGPEDFAKTEDMIKNQFERVQRVTRPQLNPAPPWSSRPNKFTNWKCVKKSGQPFCTYAKPSKHDPNKTECQFFRDMVNKIGIEKVTEKYGDIDKLTHYQDGGGKRAK
jgi:ATP-dependent helicase/DNAse subunit B